MEEGDNIFEIGVWVDSMLDAVQFWTRKGIVSRKNGGLGGDQHVCTANL